MTKPRIILIGTSQIMRFHTKSLIESGLDPVAVASSRKNSHSQEKFASENNIKNSFSDWKQMIDQEKYDGILIGSKVEFMPEILEYAIKQNIPILVEKPVGFNSKDIQKIINNSHNLIMVGYNRRYYKTVNSLKNIVSQYREPLLASMTAPDYLGIRNFYVNTIHSIDLLRYIFGNIKLEYVKHLPTKNSIKGLVATFTNEKQDVIELIGNWNASDNFSLSVFMDTKKFELKPYEQLNIYDGLEVREPTDQVPIRKYVPKLIETINLEPKDRYVKPGFFQQSNAFLKLIKNQEIPEISATLTDALKAVNLCEELVGKYEDSTN